MCHLPIRYAAETGTVAQVPYFEDIEPLTEYHKIEHALYLSSCVEYS